MLVPIVALPVSAVPPVTPLRRASGLDKADTDRGGSRRDRRRSEDGSARDVPHRDHAASTSSVGVLSALLDLPRGG